MEHREHPEHLNLRLALLALFLTAVLGVYLGILYDTQVNHHQDYLTQSVRTIVQVEKVEGLTIDECQQIAREVLKAYDEGRYDEIVLAYTSFVSVLTQKTKLKPLLPLDKLTALAGALGTGDIAFAAWQRLGARRTPVLHLSREGLYGAIYFADDGAPDNALAVMILDDTRLTVDIRRRRGRLEVCGIVREVGGRAEKVY